MEGPCHDAEPLDNLAWGSWITGFCVGDVPDQLAASYKELYGKELTLSDGCENAGYEFLKRLHDNEPIFTSSSDEIAEAVGTKGQTNPPVASALPPSCVRTKITLVPRSCKP